MSAFLKIVKSLDWFIIISVFVLCSIGVLFIYSSGVTSEGELVSREYIKQVLWIVISIAAMITVTMINPKRLPEYSTLIYLLTLVLLVYTRIFGKVVNGAKSWIGIGELGIQPSEFAKITTMLFLAWYLDSTRRDPAQFKRFLVSFGIVLLPMGLILVQPDFGTALVFFPIYIAMAYIGGIEKRYILFLILTAAFASVLMILPLWHSIFRSDPAAFVRMLYEYPYYLYVILISLTILGLAVFAFNRTRKKYYYWISFFFLILIFGIGASAIGHKVLKNYQIMRLIVFLDPSVDPLGSGWNILQSITAIGSGGIAGKGFLQGTQSHYRYLPQQSTDFIFSITAEETGFIGGLIIFSLFLLILIRLVLSMKNLRSLNQRVFISGIFAMIFFHFLINAGMAMGIMPITGIPLLFMSYGGSSLLAISLGLGLCLGIGARRFE